MIHIAAHLTAGERGLRPDFWVIEYMHGIGKLPQKGYEFVMSYTERPRCSGIVPLGYKTPEQEKLEEREYRQEHDQAREDRFRRRTGGMSSPRRRIRG